MKPKEILLAFDNFLAQKKKTFSAVIIGGGALSLLGIITRETQDIDILDPQLPKDIDELAREFAGQMNAKKVELLKTKLFAFCDRDQDRDDCIKLNPSPKELSEAVEWVKEQDQDVGWPKHVEFSIKILAKDLGHDA